LHQIRTACCEEIRFRDVSCTCIESCHKSGHNWKIATLVDAKRENRAKGERNRKRKIPADVDSGESDFDSLNLNPIAQEVEQNVPTGTESRETLCKTNLKNKL
jgi:hypothetical protein